MANPKLEVEISAKIDQLQKGLATAQSNLTAFSTEATSKLQRVGDAIKSVALPAGIAAAAIGAMGFNAIKAYGRLESLEKGLLAVAGSSSAAQKQLDDLREVAKLPGLGLEEAVRGSISLQAIGISADVAKNAILQCGNAVATVGKGRAELDRALYGLQQLANTDFPLGEDLNIIKDAIPQVSRLLTEAFGANRSDELAKMGVTSQQVVDVILKGLGELPRVTGGVANAFENMQDAVSNAWQELGRAINETLNFEGILSGMGDALGDIVEWFKGLDTQTRKAIVYVAAGTAAFLGLLAALGAIVTIAPIVFGSITLMTGGIAAVTAAVAVAATAIIANWRTISVAIQEHNVKVLSNLSKFVRALADMAAALGLTSLFGQLNIAQNVLSVSSKNLADNIKRTKEELFAASNAAYAKIATDRLEAASNETVKKTLQGVIKERKSNLELYRLEGEMIQKMGKRYKPPVLKELPGQSTIGLGTVNITGLMTEAAARAAEVADAFNGSLAQTLEQGIANSFGNLASMIGNAIGEGTSVMEAAGAGLLSSLGSILVDLGKMTLAVGIGIQGVKIALKSLNPFAAIAAGVALVALGTAFSKGAQGLANRGGGGSSDGQWGSTIPGQGTRGDNVTSGTVVRPAYADSQPHVETLIRGGDLVKIYDYNKKRQGR